MGWCCNIVLDVYLAASNRTERIHYDDFIGEHANVVALLHVI